MLILLDSFQLVARALPQIVSGTTLRANVLRFKVLAAAVWHRHQLSALVHTSSPALRRIIEERPASVVGTLIWPYICASWNAPKRLNHLSQHYNIVDTLGEQFQFSADEHIELLCLADIHPGLKVVMDQPSWFIREGGFTLNLFIDDFRAYSLAFAFCNGPDGGVDCLIGSLQGRNTEDAQERYRTLTKTAHGLRPRDLLIEVCRSLCRHWKVRRLLGIQNGQRHQLHKYFGNKAPGSQNYDVIWEDRGGVVQSEHFYRLPLEPNHRRNEEIKPNKRSLYRRRYDLLDRIDGELSVKLSGGVHQVRMAAE